MRYLIKIIYCSAQIDNYELSDISFTLNNLTVRQNPSYTTTLRITLVWSYKRDGCS